MPGYSDYQRIVNWDGPVIWEILTKAVTGEAESAIADCSRYGYILGRAFLTGEPFRLTFRWFLDEGATKPIGERWVELDPNIGQPAQLRIPNMGPWVQVHLEGKEGASKCTATIRLGLTNRTDPLLVIPRQPLLLARNKAAADPEADTFYPTDYYAGPALCHIEDEGQNVRCFLEVATGPGIVSTADLIESPAGPIFTDQKIILPPGMWRITGISAVGKTFALRVTASYTGSS